MKNSVKISMFLHKICKLFLKDRLCCTYKQIKTIYLNQKRTKNTYLVGLSRRGYPHLLFTFIYTKTGTCISSCI